MIRRGRACDWATRCVQESEHSRHDVQDAREILDRSGGNRASANDCPRRGTQKDRESSLSNASSVRCFYYFFHFRRSVD